jgi:hypothetical protein
MSSALIGAPLISGNRTRAPRPLTEAELAQLDQPLHLLEDPAPHTKLGQQVRHLEQHGLYKMARAVKACGRVGEKWTYGCGRSALRKIIRSHRRFCCFWCDSYVAGKLFREHRAYRERLHPAGTLHRVTVRSNGWPVSREGIRAFEDAIVQAFREYFKVWPAWGLKFLTHYEDAYLVARGILALPPGASPPPDSQSIPHSTCVIGRGVSPSAFEEMLADALRPRLTEGHGVLRADLMAAFQGGNHFRSLGLFYGLVTKKRKEHRQENLHLSTTRSGAGSEGQRPAGPAAPTCPFCGPPCVRTTISIEPLSELEDIPRFKCADDYAVPHALRELLHRRYVF